MASLRSPKEVNWPHSDGGHRDLPRAKLKAGLAGDTRVNSGPHPHERVDRLGQITWIQLPVGLFGEILQPLGVPVCYCVPLRQNNQIPMACDD